MVKILVCCVIYNQDLFETKTYRSFLKGLSHVYIYDNSQIVKTNTKLIPNSWIYKSDPTNKGLSYAYNKVAKYAKQNGFEWLVLTDQDTLFSSQAYDIYEKSIIEYTEEKLFCPLVRMNNQHLMSPFLCRHYIGRANLNIKENMRIDISKYSIINSGMMINIDTFLSVGGYNERVFLDFSDCQFIEKLSKKIKYARIIDILCIQSFSNLDLDNGEKLKRFELFCKSLKYYTPLKKIDNFWLFMVVLKRACSVSYSLRSLRPLVIMFNKYIK